jgi:hypothetical protein
MNRIKSVARSVSFSTSRSTSSRKSGRFEREKLEPTVGFQMTLYDSAADGTFKYFKSHIFDKIEI